MDWQTFIQWFFIVASGASVFGAWLAWASRKNGRETRELQKTLHEETVAVMKKFHEETLTVLDRMDKRADERFATLVSKKS
ncbi:MAG: hypothetical protein ONB05_00300 [candidate division KSB1 bacterium]|nr:hypothetical protein [candidate division KSB1 bacterium]